MDLTTSVYNGVSNVSSTVGYYWQSLKDRVICNYYYYFPPKPTQMVFMMLEPDAEEIQFVTDELGNSVFLEGGEEAKD
jgi:hypothetical protein